LNELRHRKNTALKLKFPLSRADLPAVQAALGREGLVEGKDYRGIAVVGAARRIPDSPWFLVTKIDRSEAYSALRSSTRSFAIITFLVVILSLGAILLAWSGRDAEQYRQLYEAETERRALASHYEYLHPVCQRHHCSAGRNRSHRGGQRTRDRELRIRSGAIADVEYSGFARSGNPERI
jgi:hypothetical protein